VEDEQPTDTDLRTVMRHLDEWLPVSEIAGMRLFEKDLRTCTWKLDEAAFAEGRINTTIRLPRSPLILSRELSLVGSTLRMDYTLANVGSRPEAWLWAWHPLLSIKSGDRLELPDEVDSLFVETAQHPDARRGEIWDWPAHADCIRLDALELDGDNSYVKAFAGPDFAVVWQFASVP
jgi:hypothetical protein